MSILCRARRGLAVHSATFLTRVRDVGFFADVDRSLAKRG